MPCKSPWIRWPFWSNVLLKKVLLILLKSNIRIFYEFSVWGFGFFLIYLKKIKTDSRRRLPKFCQIKAVVSEKIILKNLSTSWILENGSPTEELPYIAYKVKCLEVLRSTNLIQANSDLDYSEVAKINPKREYRMEVNVLWYLQINILMLGHSVYLGLVNLYLQAKVMLLIPPYFCLYIQNPYHFYQQQTLGTL